MRCTSSKDNRIFKNALVFWSRQIKRARCHTGFDAQETWQSSNGQKKYAKMCKTCNACKVHRLRTFLMEEVQIHGLKWIGKCIHPRKDRKWVCLKVLMNKCELFQTSFFRMKGVVWTSEAKGFWLSNEVADYIRSALEQIACLKVQPL